MCQNTMLFCLSISAEMSAACDHADGNENEALEDEIKCWETFFNLLFGEKLIN
jgi:hypothetical protein